MRELKDYLHPLWKRSLETTDNQDDVSLNKLILDTIDAELQLTEDDTIKAKAQSFLDTASDEWLDYWGSWFGLQRKENQSDDDYRQAIKYHVKHGRNTIPDLRQALADFLNTDVSNVNIYEPYTNIFILNNSILNGNDRLQSDYYHYAVIDIQISVPFPPEIIDIINWFRPAGVIWVLSYTPGRGDSAEIWQMSPTGLGIDYLDTLAILTGFSGETNLTLSPGIHNNLSGLHGFWLNESLLNSLDVLQGDPILGQTYYNYLGTLHGLVKPTDTDTPDTLKNKVQLIDPNLYERLSNDDASSLTVPISPVIDSHNLLAHSASFLNWDLVNGARLAQNKTNRGHSEVELPVNGSYLTSKGSYQLVKDKSYIISLTVDSDRERANISFYADIDSVHTKVLLTDKVLAGVHTYTAKITYVSGAMVNPKFYFDNKLHDLAGSMYASEPMLVSEADYKGSYTDSVLDYNTPQSSKYQYVYGFFNFRKFFFDNIQSYGSVVNAIGHQPSNTELNQYMSDYLDIKSFATAFAGKHLNNRNTHVQLMFYNFDLKLWVNYEDDNLLVVPKVEQRVNFKNLAPLLNASGTFAVGFEINTLPYDYFIDFDLLGLGTTKYGDPHYTLNVFAPDDEQYDWIQSVLTPTEVFDYVVNHNNVIDRYQEHYPIRYIKNTIKSVAPYSATKNTKATSEPYVNYPVTPHTNTDPTKPLVSVSVLGARVANDNHKNLLNNLLVGGVFTNNLLGKPEGLNKTKVTNEKGLMSNYDIHVAPISSANEQGIQFDSQVTYHETSYQFRVNAQAESEVKVYVRAILSANGYNNVVKEIPLTINNTKQVIELNFDTNKMFPDHTSIQVVTQALGVTEFYLNDPTLRVATKVLVDDKEVPNQAPDIVFDSQAALDTNATGGTKYDDIVFTDDSMEHSVLVDLGTVHNDISSLFVHHGSDSLAHMTYDSCVQTSIDGVNWVTWYDNYREDKKPLDAHYEELTATPYEVEIPVFNVHQDREDLGQSPYTPDDNGKLQPNQTAVSAVAERYPSFSLASLMGTPTSSDYLVDTKERIDDYDNTGYQPLFDLLNDPTSTSEEILDAVHDFLNGNYGNIFPTLENNRVYSPDEYILSLQDYLNTENNKTTTTTTTTTTEDAVINNLLHSPLTYAQALEYELPYNALTKFDVAYSDIAETTTASQKGKPKVAKKAYTSPKQAKAEKVVASVKQATLVQTDSGILKGIEIPPILIPDDNGLIDVIPPIVPTDPETPEIDPATLFNLSDDNSHLNGTKDIADGTVLIPTGDYQEPDIDNPHIGGVPVDPTKYLQQTLIQANIVSIVEQDPAYVNMFKVLKITKRADKVKFIRDILVGKNHGEIMFFTADVDTKLPWSFSIWNSYLNQGTWVDTKELTGTGRLMITATSLLTAMDASGNVYGMVTTQVDQSGAKELTVTKAQLRLLTFPADLQYYQGGLYPLANHASDTNLGKIYKGNGEAQNFFMYSIDDTLANQMVTISFNLNASQGGGSFNLLGSSLAGVTLPSSPIEIDNQHYSYVVHLPDELDDTSGFSIHLEKTNAVIQITGFKVELGTQESPYVAKRATTATKNTPTSTTMTLGNPLEVNVKYSAVDSDSQSITTLVTDKVQTLSGDIVTLGLYPNELPRQYQITGYQLINTSNQVFARGNLTTKTSFRVKLTDNLHTIEFLYKQK